MLKNATRTAIFNIGCGNRDSDGAQVERLGTTGKDKGKVFKRLGYGTSQIYVKSAKVRYGKDDQFGKAGRIIRFIAPFDGKIGLDVGCGEGLATRKVSTLGSIMVGCDLDLDLLQIAKEHDEKRKSLFLQCNGEILPFKSAVFDFVLAFDVLEHVPHPSSMLLEISRTLKAGGVLVLAVPNAWGPNETLWRIARRAHNGLMKMGLVEHPISQSPHVQSFNVFLLKKMIHRSGLRLARISPHNFLKAAAFIPIHIFYAALNAIMDIEEDENAIIVGELSVKLDESHVGKLLDWMDNSYGNKLFFPFASGFDFICEKSIDSIRTAMPRI